MENANHPRIYRSGKPCPAAQAGIIPYTGKHRKHNPEQKTWKGRSYRKGGANIRSLRDALHLRSMMATWSR